MGQYGILKLKIFDLIDFDDEYVINLIKNDDDKIRLLRIERFLKRWHRMNDREKQIETENICKEADREFGTNFWELEQTERFYLSIIDDDLKNNKRL